MSTPLPEGTRETRAAAALALCRAYAIRCKLTGARAPSDRGLAAAVASSLGHDPARVRHWLAGSEPVPDRWRAVLEGRRSSP